VAVRTAILIFAALAFSLFAGQAFADSLMGASKQRIGNYDVELITEPKSPVPGSPTNIMIRIGGVNGDDLVDVPVIIRIADKDNTMLQRTNPIVVPYGHYTYQFTFSEPGRHTVYIDLNDQSYSGQVLTFTFFVNVAGPFDYLYVVVPSVAVAAAAAGAVMVIRKKKKSWQMSMK
jgi:hypothetical protein